jgi:PadR family transcriptional regulator PadR
MGALMDLDAEDRKFQKQLNAGATALALLGLLGRTKHAMYGYEIAKALEAKASGQLPMNQGALYPVLRSLEQQGCLSSYVEPSVAGPARKYYEITEVGRQVLPRWLASWRRTNEFVDSVLESKHVGERTRSRRTVSPGIASRAETAARRGKQGSS